MKDEFEEETFYSEGNYEEETIDEDDSELSIEEKGFLKGYEEALENEEE